VSTVAVFLYRITNSWPGCNLYYPVKVKSDVLQNTPPSQTGEWIGVLFTFILWWLESYCVNVARKIISNTLSKVVFQLWTCTDMDSFTFESNISSSLFLPLLITYFPSYTCTFHFLCACRGPALLAGMGWDVTKTNLLSKSQNCDFTICKFKQWAAEGLMRSSDCSNQYLADQRFYVYVQPQIQKSCKKKKKECMK